MFFYYEQTDKTFLKSSTEYHFFAKLNFFLIKIEKSALQGNTTPNRLSVINIFYPIVTDTR